MTASDPTPPSAAPPAGAFPAPGEVDAGLLELVERGTAFARTLGVRLVRLGPQTVLVHPDNPDMHNHVGGPHAAALFGLAETAAAAVVHQVFGDLYGEHVPLMGGADIRYRSIARGEVTAEAHFAGDGDAVRRDLAARGRTTFPVEVVLRTAEGTECARMTARMALRRTADALA